MHCSPTDLADRMSQTSEYLHLQEHKLKQAGHLISTNELAISQTIKMQLKTIIIATHYAPE